MVRKGISAGPRAARRRLRRLALVSGMLIAFGVVTSLATLPLTMVWHNVQTLDRAIRHPPSPAPVVAFSRYSAALKTEEGMGGFARTVHRASSWMGHDDLGRSLLFRVLPGFLVSSLIGLAAALMAVCIGTTWGAVAAYAGGRIDSALMRIVDVLYGLPYILMVILMKIALTRPLTLLCAGRTQYAEVIVVVLAIGSVSWLTMARVIRGQVLSLRNQLFVEAAKAAGAGPVRILARHILPNVIGPVVVYATLVIPQAILQEAFLSFLGIGIQPPTPSLGKLAAEGVEAVNLFVGYWWLIVFPCGLLMLTLLALNLLGDRLRDALDPRSSSGSLV